MKAFLYNALTSFCLALLAPFFIASFFAPSMANAQATDYEVKRMVFLEISASINPATYNYLQTELKRLNDANGDMAVIKMSTPGGLVTTTKDIIALIGESDVPVAVWITPEGASATSAGAIIASSAHLLVMSEGTNIGAATPIGLGKDIEQKDARSKAINDLVALVSSLAETRGRNAEAFSKMISEAASFSANEAKEKKIVDAIINSQVDLVRFVQNREVRIKGKVLKLSVAQGASFDDVEMDPGQQILNIFSNPMTAYILFIIGAALLYLEFQAPGGFIAGAVGVVFLVMAGIGFQVLPLNFGALGLIVLSFILFILEVYITSYGILALAGTAALIFGSLFLFRTENAYLDISLPLVISVVAAILLYVGIVGFVLFKGMGRKKKKFFSSESEIARVSKVLAQENGDTYYLVRVSGEIWKAKSQTAYSPGDKAKVKDQDNDKMILILE